MYLTSVVNRSILHVIDKRHVVLRVPVQGVNHHVELHFTQEAVDRRDDLVGKGVG